MTDKTLPPLDGACVDTLIALVESGPLWDGDVPSKRGRDDLIERGLAVRVVVAGEDGWTAATYRGRDAYKERYMPGEVGTIAEARAWRIAQRTLRSANL